MAKTQALRIRHPLSEDEAGVVYRAKDSSGHRVNLRKPKPGSPVEKSLKPEEEVAYQVAIERLRDIHHPSLLQVVSGHTDPEDGLPYITTKPAEGEVLAEKLKLDPLTIEETTFLLSQALETSELVSHLLSDDGVWIETPAESILVTKQAKSPCFVFWPAPLKAVCGESGASGYDGIVELTERVLDWKGREVDEREGGHLQLWLKWLKGDGRDAPIREAREMLAAAAGVEPPEPIEQLAMQSQRKPGLFEGLPKLPEALKWQAPKMPLFVLLCVMFVIQAIIGWFIVRDINENVDNELRKLNEDYTSTPYTINREPGSKPERGSQPLDFD